MNIAYIAGYQGEELIIRRQIEKNRALAGTQKIKLVSDMLRDLGHFVRIYSHGITARSNLKFDNSFSEKSNSNLGTEVIYAASLACKGLNIFISAFSLLRIFINELKENHYDIVIVYNLSLPEILISWYAWKLNIPVILEYEDSAVVSSKGKIDFKSFLKRFYIPYVKKLYKGIFAASPELLDEFGNKPKMLLRGIVENTISPRDFIPNEEKSKVILYSGGLSENKGIDRLVQGWLKYPIDGWVLHITGDGEMKELVEELSQDEEKIVYHGNVQRSELATLLLNATICVNPHRCSDKVGNISPFKLVEYLASNNVVVTTPICVFEKFMNPALVITKNDSAEAIMDGIRYAVKHLDDIKVVGNDVFKYYGYDSVKKKLSRFILSVYNN